MHYERLDTSQQKQLLEQRLNQYEAEHYQHALNKHLLEASGDTSDQTKSAIAQADEAMATLDHAHSCCKDELVRLDTDHAEPPAPAPAQAGRRTKS